MDEMNFWDRDEVVERIRQMERLGRDISYVGVLESAPQLLFAAVHYYKNWAVAVTSAGIDYTKVRRNEVWDKGKLMNLLKKYKNSGDSSTIKGFRYNEFEKKHPKLFHSAVYHFGGWASALSAIGMDYNKVKKFTAWDRGKIKRRIIALYKKEKDISYKVMRNSGYTSLLSAANFWFGGWGKAVSACGLDYDRIRKK